MRQMLIVILFLFTPLFCFASGYALFEMNAAAHGMAHAYACRVDDPSAIWYNPAGLTRIDDSEISASTTWIHTAGDFTPRATGILIDQVEGNFFPTNFYWARRFSDDLVFGFGIYNPFGLKTEWPENSVAALISSRAELRTFYATPSVGYRFSPNFSIGGGIDFVYADVNLQRRVSLTPLAPITIFNEIDADDTDFGFNLGALVETEANWNFAVTYKHNIDLDFDGEVIFGSVPNSLRPFFPDGNASVSLTLPSNLTVAASTSFEDWYIEGDLIFTGWDDVQSIGLDFETNTPILRDVVLRRDYENSWAIRLGAEYRWTDHFDVRVGYLHDETPVPDQAVDPILPDGTRNGLTFGAGYDAESWHVDAAYMILFFADRTTPLNNFQDPPANLVAAGDYQSSAHLISIGFGYRF